jgi:hypothetical protein
MDFDPTLPPTPPEEPSSFTAPTRKLPHADPTLVPIHTSFQVADPILKESLRRIDHIANDAKNAFDSHIDRDPLNAARFQLNQIRAEKIRLEIIKAYADIAISANKIVSTEKEEVVVNKRHDEQAYPPELESVLVALLARKNAITVDVDAE